MKPARYIISQSSIDLVSTLNHYERYRSAHEVKIIVSSTAENYQFLRSANLPESAVEYLSFPSKSFRMRQLLHYLQSLWRERDQLERMAGRISSDPHAEVIFHSWHMDPHTSYLVARVAKSHRVTLVDVLEIASERIRFRDLISRPGAKSLLSFLVFSCVFGRIFFISGSRDHQFICLDLKRVPIVIKPKGEAGTAASLSRYLYKPESHGKTACLTYRDPWGVDEVSYGAIYRSVVEVLIRGGYNVVVKVHPQSSLPGFLADYPLKQVPKYVPFELIDLGNVSLVVGLSGASLLSTGLVPTVSFLKLVYEEHSSYYAWEMSLLGRNPAIRFVRSIDELEAVVCAL